MDESFWNFEGTSGAA